jgi:hypothetical protein
MSSLFTKFTNTWVIAVILLTRVELYETSLELNRRKPQVWPFISNAGGPAFTDIEGHIAASA